MAERLLFPVRYGLLELTIDDARRGIYLAVERPAAAARQQHPDLRSVIRRRFDPEDKVPDVKYARGDVAAARAEYEALADDLAAIEAPEDRWREAERRLDVTGYLEWLALNTLLGNGDNVDEIFFLGTDHLGAPDFGLMGWDPDDLFVACHHGGEHALEDPAGLLFCAEGKLERALLSDPVGYARYVDALRTVALWLTPERFDAAVDHTRQTLLPWFEDPEVSGAMVRLIESEPSAATPEGAQAAISAALDALSTAYAERRAALLEAARAWATAGP